MAYPKTEDVVKKLSLLFGQHPDNDALRKFTETWNANHDNFIPERTAFEGYTRHPFFRLTKLPKIDLTKPSPEDLKNLDFEIRDFYRYTIVAINESRQEQMQLYPGFEDTMVVWGRRFVVMYNISLALPTDDNPEYDHFQNFLEAYENELRGVKPYKNQYRFGIIIGKRYIEGVLTGLQVSLDVSNVARANVSMLSDYEMRF